MITRKNYGLPYTGSKNTICRQISELFPKKKNFYDLFCGGCAVTHYLMEKHQFEHYHINDSESMIVEFFINTLNGKYHDRNEWISREDFQKLKNTDPFVRYVWSFGNNGREYLYGKKIEPYKKALHYAIIFDDFSLLKNIFSLKTDDYKNALNGINDIQTRRLKLRQMIKHDFMQNLSQTERIKQMYYGGVSELNLRSQGIESMERVRELENIRRHERVRELTYSTKDYSEIKIPADSVIYCDIPYINTSAYGEKNVNTFDYERFYYWCAEQTEPLFISSYEMPADKFVCIKEINKRSLLSPTSNNAVIEKVFIPVHQSY